MFQNCTCIPQTVQMQSQKQKQIAQCIKRKRPFTEEEDAKLIQLVSFFGQNSWKMVAANIPGRTQRQCRERYKTYLAPGIKKTPWTKEEDELLLRKYNELGPKWAIIATFFAGRTDNTIKNRYNNHLLGKKSFYKESSSSDSNELSSPSDLPMQTGTKHLCGEKLPSISFLDHYVSNCQKDFSAPLYRINLFV